MLFCSDKSKLIEAIENPALNKSLNKSETSIVDLWSSETK
jgi:hypothetical protein